MEEGERGGKFALCSIYLFFSDPPKKPYPYFSTTAQKIKALFSQLMEKNINWFEKIIIIRTGYKKLTWFEKCELVRKYLYYQRESETATNTWPQLFK